MSQLRENPLRIVVVVVSVVVLATTTYLRFFRSDDGPTPAEQACIVERSRLTNAIDDYQRRFADDGGNPFDDTADDPIAPSTDIGVGVGGPTISDLRGTGLLSATPEYYTVTVAGSIEVTEAGEAIGCT